MSTLIEIPDDIAELLANQSAASGVTPAELISQWVHDAQNANRPTRAQKIAAMQELVNEALESGPSDATLDEVLVIARARAGVASHS